jgi:HlyD family secretion protein
LADNTESGNQAPGKNATGRTEPRPKTNFVSGSGADRPITRKPPFWQRGSRITRLAILTFAIVLAAVAYARLGKIPQNALRVSRAHVTIAPVKHGIFHDFVPLRGSVIPHDVIYVDASEGGKVNKVLVEPGDKVTTGQPLLEFGNTSLQLAVIQQESYLNQAISQLQQNEIALEETKISNERALAQAEYNIVRLSRLTERQLAMAARGATSVEQKDNAQDELIYNKELRRMQSESNSRQAELRARLLPSIHDQLASMGRNLPIVRAKLDELIVRSPVNGRVTDIDLKIGENRAPGQRLAVITPETGFKVSADIDEFYLARVHKNELATVNVDGQPVVLRVTRVYPEVKQGRFKIDLAFNGATPPDLLPGQAVQGKLSLGEDQEAMLIPSGPFLETSTGDWLFVLKDDDDRLARRLHVKIGRRNLDQVEVLEGLREGERVLVSDYTGLSRVELLDIAP